MLGVGIHSPEDRRFAGLAAAVIDDILVRDPVHATRVGDHRFDGRLPDPSADGSDEFARILRRHAGFLASVDEVALSRITAIDLAVLRREVAVRLHDLTVVRPQEWNPLVWNPAAAIFTLVERPYGPAQRRGEALVARLRGVGEFLDGARHTLGRMPGPHVEVAIQQMTAIAPMLDGMGHDLRDRPGMADAVSVGVAAVERHVDWLRRRLPQCEPDFRMGSEAYEGVLRHRLECSDSAEDVVARAHEDLDRLNEELASAAAKLLERGMGERRLVRTALGQLARASDVDDDSALDVCAEALRRATDFVAERGLVSIPAMDIQVARMPEARRGFSIAYCDAPGALEDGDYPTVLAMASAPKEWTEARRRSFYREYNRDMIHDLMVHEVMPGHALQLAWARQAEAPTGARAAFPSGLFVEGWAVYAEELMALRGFVVSEERRPAIRIQQLKMQMRGIINTILEIGIHTCGMTEAQGRRLMATRGHQEEGEIVGKWRRALVSYGRLPMYYLGYRAVAALVGDLKERHRDWDIRQIHDTLLAHGSISPTLLRSVVGLD